MIFSTVATISVLFILFLLLSLYNTSFLKQVEQELWPQCVSCFRLQGTAVKMKRHILIYHHGPRLYHFAPAIVYYFLQNQKVKDFGQHLSKVFMEKRKTLSADIDIKPSSSFNQPVDSFLQRVPGTACLDGMMKPFCKCQFLHPNALLSHYSICPLDQIRQTTLLLT